MVLLGSALPNSRFIYEAEVKESPRLLLKGRPNRDFFFPVHACTVCWLRIKKHGENGGTYNLISYDKKTRELARIRAWRLVAARMELPKDIIRYITSFI